MDRELKLIYCYWNAYLPGKIDGFPFEYDCGPWVDYPASLTRQLTHPNIN